MNPITIVTYRKSPPSRKIAAGTAINVSALVCVATSEMETDHHGMSRPPRKKPSKSFPLPRSKWPSQVVNRINHATIAQSIAVKTLGSLINTPHLTRSDRDSTMAVFAFLYDISRLRFEL